MKPDFMDRIEKVISDVLTRTCIDKLDAKVIEDILQEELIKYHNEVFTYARNIGYGDGLNKAVATEEATYSKGYYEGYNKGYDDGHESGLEEAVDRTYNEGYDDGYITGYEAGYKRGVNDTIGEVQNQSWKEIKIKEYKDVKND